MDVKRDKSQVGLLGWLTLTNKTSKSFKDSDLAVVAGSLNHVTDKGQSHNRSSWDRAASCLRFEDVSETVVVQSASASYSGFTSGGGGGGADEIVVTASRRAEVREAKQEDLGDYKLYRAPQAVSVEPHQTKQIAFLSKDNVALEQVNTYRWTLSDIQRNGNGDIPVKGRHIYELDNSKTGNLAAPLPAGTVRAMSHTDDGVHTFIGEAKITNKPIGLPVELEMADSFLVTALFFEVDQDDDKVEVRVDVKNATDKKITAEIDFDILKDIKIRRGKKRKSLPKDDKVYRLTVPAEKTVTFSFKAKMMQN